jgi:hypothetical protein
MLQIVTKCNISYPHSASLACPVKCILFAGAVPGSRPWRAAECPRPGGLGDGLEAPNEPARRAPYEGVAAFFRLRNPRKMTGRQPGHGCGGLGLSPMKLSAKRALSVRWAEARAAGQRRVGGGWQPLAPGRLARAGPACCLARADECGRSAGLRGGGAVGWRQGRSGSIGG